jgi:hypothetical protein
LAARIADGRVVEVADLLVPDVGGDFDDRRTAAAVAQVAEGAAQHVGNLARHDEMLGELRHAAHFAGRAVVRVDPGDAARIALRDYQQGHGLAVGLGDAAIGVLAAGAMLHAEGADLLAGGDAGDRVGHVQADTFLAHDDRADVRGGGVFQQVVDGVAAKDLDSLALHDFSNCLANFHLDCSPRVDLPEGRTRVRVWQPG